MDLGVKKKLGAKKRAYERIDREYRLDLICLTLLVIGCLVASYYYSSASGMPPEYYMYEQSPDMLSYLIVGVMTTFMSEFMYRCVLFVAELSHLNCGKVKHTVKQTFGSKDCKRVLICFILMMSGTIGYVVTGGSDAIKSVLLAHWQVFASWVIIQSALLKLVGLRNPSPLEVSKLLEDASLNVAHGMAWVYHVGYLKLILPGMKTRMLNSRFWEEKVKGKAVMVPKFFVLLPESCFAFPTLTDADPCITHAGPLEEFSVNRAGNVKRTYRNNVYTMKRSDGMTYYFTVEYATPLLSLYEMSEAPEAGLSAEDRSMQMRIFYRSLKSIFENTPDCRENVVLIPYKDKTEDGYVPIGDIIMEAIHEEIDNQTTEN